MSIHLLPDARAPYAPLLKPIFNPKSIPNTLAVVLLDWDEPWHWLNQLRERISILRSVLNSLNNDHKDIMDDTMRSWRERRTGPAIEGMTPVFLADRTQQNTARTPLLPPLGTGEWDDPLGIPICVVCLNAEKIHLLAREHAWTDTQFDCILQHLRTILLKHGGSLMYTSSTEASDALLTDLIRSSLCIQSLLKKTILKPEAIQRDSILIPPNWDTAGKIRTLDSGFDVEAVGRDWETEIAAAAQNIASQPPTLTEPNHGTAATALLPSFSHKIQNPDRRFANTTSISPTVDQTDKPRPDLQAFLASQLPILRRLEAEDAEVPEGTPLQPQSQPSPSEDTHLLKGKTQQIPLRSPAENNAASTSHAERITPMLMNVGGMNVDVEAAVKELRERAALRDTDDGRSQHENAQTSEDKGRIEDDVDGEKRLEWLAGLATRRKAGVSTPSTPQR